MIEKIEEVTGPARPMNQEGVSVINSITSRLYKISLKLDQMKITLDDHHKYLTEGDRR